MKVKEMIEKLDLKLLTKDVSEDALYAEVEGGYASDLLSNAMGQGQPGMGNDAGTSECCCCCFPDWLCGSYCSRRWSGCGGYTAQSQSE